MLLTHLTLVMSFCADFIEEVATLLSFFLIIYKFKLSR